MLVVDDDDGCREVLAFALGHAEYHVALAAGGADALRSLAGGNRPDAIVLDLMMPDVDGFQVLAAVRATPDIASLPVIIVSATVNASTRIPGADAVLSKPFDFDRLVEVLGHLCDASSSRVA